MRLLYISLICFITLNACNQSNNSSNKKAKDSSSEWLIENNGIGSIKIGYLFDHAGLPNNLEARTFNLNSNDRDGNPVKNKIISIRNNAENLITVELDRAENTIKSMAIDTDQYKTAEGFYSGMTLRDFIRIYPNYEIFYDYDTKDIFARCAEYPDIRFIVDPTMYNGDGGRNFAEVLFPLSFEEFGPLAEIIEIKIQ